MRRKVDKAGRGRAKGPLGNRLDCTSNSPPIIMPRISQFYGIAIYMYYRDHAPPHFHAIYGKDEAVVDIGSATVSEGELPRRALALVTEWATVHRQELQRNWESARTGQALDRIAPLD